MSLPSAAFRVEAAVIGAGVIGLATARALALRGKEVVIIERADAIGSGTSSRNSEVVHAGIYYPPDSLKARLCVRGRDMLYDFCARRGVDVRRIGKLVVATDLSQARSDLRRIEERARANGVTDLRLLDPEDVRAEYEPEVACAGALLSPSTGVVDSHGFMTALLGEAEERGAALALQSPVEGAKAVRGGGGGGGGILLTAGGMDLLCENVANCAGLHADKIASMICKGDDRREESDGGEGEAAPATDGDNDEEDGAATAAAAASPSSGRVGIAPTTSSFLRRRRQYFAKGNYYRLQGQKSPFHHLVYPIPEKAGGLGVHVTVDLGGSVRFGPDVEWIDHAVVDPDNIDLTVDAARAESFYAKVRRYWPGLEDGALAPDYAGIRPKLGHPDMAGACGDGVSADFVIEGPRDHGVPGLVNLLGMESPGLTSSMAVAEFVADMLLNET